MKTSSPDEKHRWERLGLSRKSLEEQIEATGEYVADIGRYRDNACEDEVAAPPDWGRHCDLLTYYSVLQLHHVQVDKPILEAGQCVLDMSQLAVDYFFGAWREATVWHDSGQLLTAEQCRRKLDWLDELRLGLTASLVGKHYEDATALATYPDTDLRDDLGSWDRTKDDCRFFIVLTRFLRDKSLRGCTRLLPAIRKSRKRRPRLLLNCLEAIDNTSVEELVASLSKYLDFFRSVEMDTQKSIYTSLEAAILWQLAIGMGLGNISLDESYTDLFISRESLQLNDASVRTSRQTDDVREE